MKLPPRKKTQHLLSWSLIIYAYDIIPFMVTTGCYLAYFWVFWSYEINIKDLVWSGMNDCSIGCWQSPNFYANTTRNPSRICATKTQNGTFRSHEFDFESNGFCFDVYDQEKIQRQACTAYYLTMVMGQVIGF